MKTTDSDRATCLDVKFRTRRTSHEEEASVKQWGRVQRPALPDPGKGRRVRANSQRRPILEKGEPEPVPAPSQEFPEEVWLYNIEKQAQDPDAQAAPKMDVPHPNTQTEPAIYTAVGYLCDACHIHI